MVWRGFALVLLMTATCCSGLDGQLVRTVTCHGSISNLTCADGVIKLYDVRYGRTGSSFCRRTQRHEHMEKEHCLLPEAYRIMSNRCDGEKVCNVMVSDSVFADPCPHISKYLDVTYTCLASQTVLTCEGFVQRLSCAKGVISVQKANYGRTSGQFCRRSHPLGGGANVNCVLPRTRSVLSQRCDGKSVCEVTASSKIFSDPCPGTTKYLNTSYTCLPAKTSITCEHSVPRLTCGMDVIKVFYANYGRRDSKPCSAERPSDQLTNVNCFRLVTTEISHRCDGKNWCSVPLSDFSDDPCHGTFKYLEVSYGCLPAKKNISCEGSLASLSCGNALIRIYDANYGRRDSTICTDGRPAGQLTNTRCLLSTSTDIVAKWCNDKSSCEIMATNDVFTDPCFGTYKYLEVSYGCIKTSVTVTDH